uniref:ENTH domain-containing protein n=1 Tax=Leersia perrieri TaxID=77586 RepID=A0A0D9XB22_9ORYZ
MAATTRSRGRWQLLGMQASGFVQEKYKQARLALGDVTPAELLVQEATSSCDGEEVDARTLACIAEAAFDMDDYWRIAGVLRRRMARAGDWKEWRPVYKALVVLEYLLTHGPPPEADLGMEDMAAQLRHLRGFTHVDHTTGFDWGACMRRRCDTLLALLTDADRLRDARRPHVDDSSSPSSASSRTTDSATSWSVASGSPTMFMYRHDKKFDAYTADDDDAVADDWMMHHHLHLQQQQQHHALHSIKTTTDSDDHTWEPNSPRFVRSSGFQSLSQPGRRPATKKLQHQLTMDY